MSTSYRVVWEVDVDADSPRAAAIAAMRMQDEHTTANVFAVREQFNGSGVVVEEIDLGDVPRHDLPEYEPRQQGGSCEHRTGPRCHYCGEYIADRISLGE